MQNNTAAPAIPVLRQSARTVNFASNKTGYIWDVKPAGDKYLRIGTAQIKKYTTGKARFYKHKDFAVGGSVMNGKKITPATFDYFGSDGATYRVSYWYESNGVISYTYFKMNNNSRSRVPIAFDRTTTTGIAMLLVAAVILSFNRADTEGARRVA